MAHRIRELWSLVSNLAGSTSAVPSGKPTHEAPVSQSEELGQRVEWQVVPRALRVMVWRGHLRAGRVEATAGSHLGHRGDAGSSAGEHLVVSA